MFRPLRIPLAFALFVSCGSPQGSHPVDIDRGDLLPTGSLRVLDDLALDPGSYVRAPVGVDGRSGVIRVEGVTGVTLDLTGVELRGTPEGTQLDRNEGWGIVVRSSRDVVIRGGRLGGYRGCIVVQDSANVTIEDVEFDSWFGERLLSTAAAADPADRLSPTGGDADEWIASYGAAIGVMDSTGVVVRGCRGRRGQNGIVLLRTDGSRVHDNDFSFLSGWGLGLFRASGNLVGHNVFDYCARGFSHGVYAAPHRAAGILLSGPCTENTVAFNSATHGGSGILVHGDAEEGPGGENVFYGNDLRFAAGSAVEITGSDGDFVVDNQLSGCRRFGVSCQGVNGTVIARNEIHDTPGVGIAVEGGADCLVANNELGNNHIGLELEAGMDADGDLGTSRGHWVVGNEFVDNVQDLVVRLTADVLFDDNRYRGENRSLAFPRNRAAEDSDLDQETVKGRLSARDGSLPSGTVQDSTLRAWDGTEHPSYRDAVSTAPPLVPGTTRTGAEERGVANGGLETIVMGDWGPWDFLSGEPRPARRRAGGHFAATRWDTSWFRFSLATHDPRADIEVWRALAESPTVRREVAHFHDPWVEDAVRAEVGNDHFGLIARTTLYLDEGTYDLSVTSDDGVRVIVDGEVVLENWTYHVQTTDTAEVELGIGKHDIVVEYFQMDGAAVLSLELTTR